ncbi:MAG: sulfatase-like hydrolase/transferase [Planctomycetes bacterium]|nr:sulfatase-like hydrolase/transferase [Planctomycetota bacterium]
MKPPNIILIALDTFRADHTGPYGNRTVQTPALDRLAEEAVVFERAYAPAPWTLPSFAGIFTGLLPCEHGTVGGEDLVLGEEYTTLAEWLRDQGYFTKAFVAVDYLTDHFGMDQGFEALSAFLGGEVTGRIEQYEEELFSFLADPPEKPYFLMVHYFDAHHPYLPPAPYDRMYYQGDPKRPDTYTLAVIYRDTNRAMNRSNDLYKWLLGIRDIQYPIKQYAAGITHVDHHIGLLMDQLRKTGELDRSIVVLLADHGEHLTEHDIYFTHRYPYEETLRVPFMIRLPGAKHGGMRVQEGVSTLDLFPTLAGLLSKELQIPCSGINLQPYLSEKAPAPPPRHIFSEYGTPKRYTRAVWYDQYRLIRFENPRKHWFELYDHRTDPKEEHNVIDQNPEVFEKLKTVLESRFAGCEIPGKRKSPETQPEADEEVTNRLKELGY